MKIFILSFVVSLLLLSPMIKAASNPMIESFSILPNICVVARETSCEQNIRFQWRLSHASNSCLYLLGDEKALYCSDMQQQTSIVLTLNVKKDNEFILRLVEVPGKEVRRQLKVRELGKDVRQARRHVWSVF